MSRRIRRDLHKRVASAGYQQIAGDLEIRGKLLGPTATNLATGIAALSAATTTPVQLAPPVAQGGMRSISLTWSRQYTLANFSHYELQVSEDDLYWYSLRLDGSDWCDTLNEDTDCRLEYFNHSNIPLVQDAGVLVGKKLYYRVRQVTMAGLKSAWSASCNATTKSVQDLVLIDSYNRYIEISSHKGIYADDRQGHVIHDIPDAPILSGMIYSGHVIFAEAPDYLGYISAHSYADAATDLQGWSATQNTSIAAYTHGIGNAKGAVVAVKIECFLNAAKVQATTHVAPQIQYSTAYNTAPGGYNFILAFEETSRVAGVALEVTHISGAHPVPVVWDAGIPYITWAGFYHFGNMLNASNVYRIYFWLYLQGLLV